MEIFDEIDEKMLELAEKDNHKVRYVLDKYHYYLENVKTQDYYSSNNTSLNFSNIEEDNPAYHQPKNSNLIKLDAALKQLLNFLNRVPSTSLLDE